MGGHHKPELPEVPDWRIYRVEDVPQLMKVKKRLAKQGLCDPWLRNEVWRYTEEINKYSRWQRISGVLFCGWKYGLIAAIITTGVDYMFFSGHHTHSHDDKEQH